MAFTLIGGSLLVQNGVFLGAGAVAFYLGMRWPALSLKLAALFLPLVLWSAAWSAGEFLAFDEAPPPADAPMLQRCGEDERCRARFFQLREKARRDAVRSLFGAAVVPLLMLAVLALLILRDLSARRQTARARRAGESAGAEVPANSSADLHPAHAITPAPTTPELKDDSGDVHARWWLPKEAGDEVRPLPRAPRDDDARWMPRPEREE